MRRPRQTVLWTLAVTLASQGGQRLVGAAIHANGYVVDWNLITLLSLAFLAGLIVQDGYNRESWLWENWRAWVKAFDVSTAHVAECAGPQRLDWRILIRITRDIPKGELILRAYGCTGLKRGPDLKLLQSERRPFLKGETIELVAASLPIPGPGGWTLTVADAWAEFDKQKHRRWVIGSSNNLIELSIGNGFRRQTERFEGVDYSSGRPNSPQSTFRWQRDGAFLP